MHDTYTSPTPADAALVERVKAYALDASFPCLAARSAVNTHRAHFGSYGPLGSDDPVQLRALCDALTEFSEAYREPGESPVTYIALFDDDVSDELEFERRLWLQLQRLHAMDRHSWAPSVSSDPEADDFSFSIGGRAFFIVGLHPHASRISRRAPVPCLAFNFHDQFEQFRASGKYAKLQRSIRTRDVALQGDANPVLAAFGEDSEARQYSGRAVGDDWRCPFRPGVGNAA